LCFLRVCRLDATNSKKSNKSDALNRQSSTICEADTSRTKSYPKVAERLRDFYIATKPLRRRQHVFLVAETKIFQLLLALNTDTKTTINI
jgi:hypothetical protein